MLTPLEIQNQDFKQSFRGFNREEVKQFLYTMSEEMESLVQANHDMARELDLVRLKSKESRDRDKVLKDTLISAQQIKREIVENAHKEADLLVREGQLHAEKLFEHAKKQLDHLRTQISDLKRTRSDLLAELEMMLTRCNHFIEAERSMATESDKLLSLIPQSKKPEVREDLKLKKLKRFK